MSGSKRCMEREIEDLEKKAKFYSEKLEKAKFELKKKKTEDLDKFVEVIRSDSCTLCSEPLVDCIDHIGKGISSYECECSRQRIVHVQCWSRDFRCSCGVMAIAPDSKAKSVSKSTVDDFIDSRDVVRKIASSASSMEEIIEYMDYPDQLDSIKNLQRLMRETPGIPSHLIQCVNLICEDSRDINANIDRLFRQSKIIYGESNMCCNKLNTAISSISSDSGEVSSISNLLGDSDSDFSA